jgi:hypothetical protein
MDAVFGYNQFAYGFVVFVIGDDMKVVDRS